jgi:nucleotide-binding universal stress UspA family protein
MNIVVAFNDSEDARAAVAWAGDIAQHARGEVHVVYSVPAPAIPAFASGHLVEQLMTGATTEAKKPLDAVIAELKARGVAAHAHVRRWLAVDSIIEKAREVGAELIVVGRRGSSRVTQLLIGTISSEVVRLAPVSVLVARKDDPTRHAREVLVAVDGSEHSIKAIRIARSTFPDAALVLAHVGAREGEGTEVLRKAAASAGVDPKTADLRALHGDAAGALLHELSKGEYRAIVLGPRGLGALAGLLLGSVTEKVLQLAQKPVLVAR